MNHTVGSPVPVDTRGYSRDDLPDAGAVEMQFRVHPDSWPYEEWAAFHGLTPGVDDGIFADPNGDGVPNLQHVGLDENLNTGSSDGKFVAFVADDGGQNYFTISFTTMTNSSFSGAPPTASTSSGVIYTVWADDDLIGTDLTAVERSVLSSGLPALSVVTGSSTSWEYNTFRLPATIDAVDRGFTWIDVLPNPQSFELE